MIWKEREDMIFHRKENDPIQLLKKIKLLFFWWFIANFVVFPYQFTLSAKTFFFVWALVINL